VTDAERDLLARATSLVDDAMSASSSQLDAPTSLLRRLFEWNQTNQDAFGLIPCTKTHSKLLWAMVWPIPAPLLPAVATSNQDAFDWIKLDGVDKRVGADIEKNDEQQNVMYIYIKREVCADSTDHIVDVDRHPRDDVERADEDHSFDDVRLDVVWLGLSVLGGAWSRSTVASHHACLATNDTQNAPVAEDGDENLDTEERYEVPNIYK